MQIDGAGLGLPIVKEIVELHDGKVSVESEPGKGTTFAVWLPDTVQSNSEQMVESAGAASG